jgi:hypothetical protein
MAGQDLFGNEIPDPEEFKLPDGTSINELQLKNADEETQTDAMRVWFYSHYEDPANETPYTSEDGYLYFHGGPYEAKEVLEGHFELLVPDEVIEKLADELERESSEWAPRDSDDYMVDTLAPPSAHIQQFETNVIKIRKLITTPVNATEEQFFRRILYASVITALETYLSDRFIASISNNPKALHTFVETFSPFREESIKLADIFKRHSHMELYVRKILVDRILWHRLDKVSKLFADTFHVKLPTQDELKELERAIKVRHDLVHRGGKDKDGKEHTITPEDIEKVLTDTDALVSLIESQEEKFAVDRDEEEDSEEI